ncbi:MAG: O-methyltransferase [Deltaproteobacteria bacterium]|nr:O-methyltransferase [Deltaproteobacteria bacterium]
MGKMIADLEGYFRKLVRGRDELLLALEQEAREEGIPIVGPLVGQLLGLLVRATGARQVLELGTATGYSAIHLARACRQTGGRLLTLEWDPGLAERAQANLQRAEQNASAEVRIGDALEIIKALNGPWDLIFIDIDKENYLAALPDCRRLLKPGGLLVADNIGFQGAVDFNQAVFQDERWLPVQLLAFLPEHSPERDGLLLALRL